MASQASSIQQIMVVIYEKNGIKYFSIAPGEYFYKNKDNYVEKVNSEPFKGPDYMVGDLCDIVPQVEILYIL